ncbi:G-protein coupled receptor 55a [Paramormyrops kingsleyae]|uniref:G-protein coupled receptor 55a n=1 Tax=Paramormyrops kingsleyae TaxID=1676925 RepID=UPI000CD5E138|nr:lysophosphatidic acid receptor 6-like [Paramormyrops kingsleyae]XP_023700421.1 lysophosphatidic acid receptor 6-like [Paramormyrops kingsleyae]XP_023700431.1 lysophosphatidic acid receptor 6-like [Paramormyrops kingsleyae]XP_023700441.1 lysophosphatidic acid receptor 6-like [Paramormyrops kingsleyae]XP_023700450.1 lysophosphatidic acid receptor 6-like [Paramormyrops kingsleyae]
MTWCDFVCWIQMTIYIPTCITAFPLNLAALWILFFKIRRFTESMVYLANLAVNNCLFLFSLPFKIYAYKRPWNLSPKFCSFLESLVLVNIYGSIALIVCISADRYITLRYPFRRRWMLRSPRIAVAACLLIWIVMFVASIPVYRLHKKTEYCFENFTNETWDNVTLIVSMEVTFLISATAMALCSVNVMQILRAMRKRNPADAKLRNNKSLKIVLSNLVTFMVCFIPYHIAALLFFLAKNSTLPQSTIDPLRDVFRVSSCISSLNCLFDGACYYYTLKENWMSSKEERKPTSYIATLPLDLQTSTESPLPAHKPSVRKMTSLSDCY